MRFDVQRGRRRRIGPLGPLYEQLLAKGRGKEEGRGKVEMRNVKLDAGMEEDKEEVCALNLSLNFLGFLFVQR